MEVRPLASISRARRHPRRRRRRGFAEASADPELVRTGSRRPPGLSQVASVCSGTFVLAAAGLLDGRTATTHWAVASDLAGRYPRSRSSRTDLRAGRRRLEVRGQDRRDRPEPRPGRGGPRAGAARSTPAGWCCRCGARGVSRSTAAAGLDRRWPATSRAARLGRRQPRRRPVGGRPRGAGRVEPAKLRPLVSPGEWVSPAATSRTAPRGRPSALEISGAGSSRRPAVRVRESGGPAPGLPAPSRHHAGPVPPQLRWGGT